MNPEIKGYKTMNPEIKADMNGATTSKFGMKYKIDIIPLLLILVSIWFSFSVFSSLKTQFRLQL